MRQTTASSMMALLVLGAAPQAVAQSRTWANPKASEGSNSPRSLVDAINFETDTATVVNGKVTLACVADALKIDKTLHVVVEGYADGRGGDAYNMRLSEARSKAVIEYLRLMGAPAERMKFVGKGKAAPSGADAVTNFARRKALILVFRGAFDGEPVKELPTQGLPCSNVVNGEVPVAEIKSNGQTFIVSVDYAKIRNDFRAEVARMMAERTMNDAPTTVSTAAQQQATAVAGKPAGAVAGNAPGSTTNEADGPAREFRMSIVGFKTNLTDTENSMGYIEGAGMFRVPGGGIQTGIQGEFGSYRKKLQGDIAYSAIVGNFQGTVFASYVKMTGTSSDAASLYGNRSGLLGGTRLAFEWRPFGIGLMYATGVSDQSSTTGSTTSQPAQEPLGLFGADIRLGGEGVYLRATAFKNLQPQKQVASSPIDVKTGSVVELGYAFENGLSLLIRGEALPIYETYTPTANLRETRVGIGIRIGGRSSGSLNWVNIPTARMIHPF